MSRWVMNIEIHASRRMVLQFPETASTTVPIVSLDNAGNNGGRTRPKENAQSAIHNNFRFAMTAIPPIGIAIEFPPQLLIGKENFVCNVILRCDPISSLDEMKFAAAAHQMCNRNNHIYLHCYITRFLNLRCTRHVRNALHRFTRHISQRKRFLKLKRCIIGINARKEMKQMLLMCSL